jgi:hypothetical protein
VAALFGVEPEAEPAPAFGEESHELPVIWLLGSGTALVWLLGIKPWVGVAGFRCPWFFGIPDHV